MRQAYIHKLVPGDKRATVVSFDSMVANVGGVGGQGGAGLPGAGARLRHRLHRRRRVHVLAIPLYFAVRSLKEDADKIIGKAGKRSPCAAQGLAWVGGVDDKAPTAFAAKAAISRGRPIPTPRYRSDLNAARSSAAKSCGCSHAAKWPPLSTLL